MQNTDPGKPQMGEPGICLFFWDYDTEWGIERGRSSGTKGSGILDFEHTERLLELHNQYQVPACFAVVGAAALTGSRPYHDPAQIRRMHEAGHEIASHSFRHEWLPGLDWTSLLETLRHSKDALEQCIGSEVVTFVPPFNQPFDYPAGYSFSISERRATNGQRTDLSKLCCALNYTGYRFCRVAYRPIAIQLMERISRRAVERPSRLEQIDGITCVRLNIEAGFDSTSLRLLERGAHAGGLVVVYGHPHSLHAGNSQDETWLVPFLRRIHSLAVQGLIRVGLPREFV